MRVVKNVYFNPVIKCYINVTQKLGTKCISWYTGLPNKNNLFIFSQHGQELPKM